MWDERQPGGGKGRQVVEGRLKWSEREFRIGRKEGGLEMDGWMCVCVGSSTDWWSEGKEGRGRKVGIEGEGI